VSQGRAEGEELEAARELHKGELVTFDSSAHKVLVIHCLPFHTKVPERASHLYQILPRQQRRSNNGSNPAIAASAGFEVNLPQDQRPTAESRDWR
jgi:hypothetical protein